MNFGKDEETTTPTEAQLSRCQVEMYLNPSINIVPLGYKLEGSGIDDAIWFKFETDASSLQEIFDRNVVDTSTFKNGFVLTDGINASKWWDVENKEVLGGQVELPNARFMNIGIEKNDDGYQVYIMWHET
ncbi:hypothetical protein IQ254_27995 [Nodosilinea sp. LEGE 07088]|uniref:hypothetical protein n=1 Tax=Nodosilinea sp. LEGE 07088 TaxID=2777968 RepID=UPI00188127E9|nr:hypothetical protein [Nodosilinea sp. LEGE 07088]MBE9140997.1 hypothetical protein [Nodosilinea sp. LEGE 07088]